LTNQGGDRRVQHINLPGEQILQRRRRAAIGNMVKLRCPSGAGKKGTREMFGGTNP
jgi:hypothetical protein